MQFSTATVAAVAAFLPALVSAHVRMVSPPTVFRGDMSGTFDLNPLDPSGDNYPCYFTSGSAGEVPVYAPGSSQEIGLQGTAVHGGGSCQVSVTYDNPPTKDSVFKVLESYEGGCPLAALGNLPAGSQTGIPPLPYTLPADIPSGNAVIAWSWFNRIGNREMYMRCAPIKISGTNTDKTGFNALPDIFKANIANGCSTVENTNVIFPNPGSNLVGKGDGAPVGGDACGLAGSIPKPDTKPILIGIPTVTPTVTPTPTATPTPVYDEPTPTPTYVQDPVPTPTDVTTPPPVSTPETPNNGTCVHGAIVCTGLNTWSVCVYGTPKPMGKTAPGMNCKDGGMVVAPRSVRFSREHVHRRHGSHL